MTNCEKLYQYYQEHPTASNPDVEQAMGWDGINVKRYKHRLKRRGLITITPGGVETNLPFEDSEPENASFKVEAYQQLYEACINRLDTKDLSDSAFTELIREARLILEKV